MEEIKTKKKLNKRSLIIFLALAIVFGIIGFIDINSNAAESLNGIHFYIEIYNNDTVSQKYKRVVQGQDDMEVFYVQSHTENTNSEDTYALAYVVSKYPMTVYDYTVGVYESNMGQEYFDGSYPSVEYTINGQTFHIRQVGRYFTNTNNGGYNGYVDLSFDTSLPKKQLTRWYDSDEFAQMYAENNLDFKVDYDNFPIDDDMPVVSDIVRSYIINHYSSPGEEGITEPSDTYEYLTWVNTSDLPIQIEVIPIVQYYKTLFGKSEFLEEYVGDWRDYELLESGTSKYLRQTDDASLLKNYNEDYQFKKTCLSERKVNIFSETAYFFYGYRVRYVDVKNEKAGAWTVVMPSEIVNESEKWLEFSNGAIGNSSNSTGEVSDTNYGDVDKNLEEIDETIKFKDKYEIVDGDVDTQEATNWLYSVVNFIKDTPQVVGSVLGFLPQPILYGMYVTIFLGCIASAIAIVKALI